MKATAHIKSTLLFILSWGSAVSPFNGSKTLGFTHTCTESETEEKCSQQGQMLHREHRNWPCGASTGINLIKQPVILPIYASKSLYLLSTTRDYYINIIIFSITITCFDCCNVGNARHIFPQHKVTYSINLLTKGLNYKAIQYVT